MPELYSASRCTDKRFATVSAVDDKPITEARANLTELVASVRLLREIVQLSRRGSPQAAIVPVELAQAAEAAGGADAATEILKAARQQA